MHPKRLIAWALAACLVAGCARPEPAPKPVTNLDEPAQPVRIELPEPAGSALVGIEAVGAGLDHLSVSLTSASRQSLEVVIPAGTVFQAANAAAQDLIVRESNTIALIRLGERRSIKLKVACINMHKDTPGPRDRFAIAPRDASIRGASDLQRLVAHDGFVRSGFRVQQFAIWSLTDAANEKTFPSISSTGAPAPINASEIAQVKAILAAVAPPKSSESPMTAPPPIPVEPKVKKGTESAPLDAKPQISVPVWPLFFQNIPHGPAIVKIENPFDSAVRVGLRNGIFGQDFPIRPKGYQLAHVLPADYEVYLQVGNGPIYLLDAPLTAPLPSSR